MSEQEMLELAAKAEWRHPPYDSNGVFSAWVGDSDNGHWWNPLNDDGDALRLAIALKLDVNFYRGYEEVVIQGEGAPDTPTKLGEFIEACEPFGDDRFAATRRAIVRAAAEIGRGVK